MTVLLTEFEIGLQFGEPQHWTVPLPVNDPDAYVVEAKGKVVAAMDGSKQFVASVLVRDRRVDSPAIGAPGWECPELRVFLLHRIGQEAEVPEGAGTLVGSFSTHGNEHHWHVFAPKREPGPAKPIATGVSSRAPKASSLATLPSPLPTAPPGSPPGQPQRSTGTPGSAPSGAKPSSVPSPARKA